MVTSMQLNKLVTWAFEHKYLLFTNSC